MGNMLKKAEIADIIIKTIEFDIDTHVSGPFAIMASTLD